MPFTIEAESTGFCYVFSDKISAVAGIVNEVEGKIKVTLENEKIADEKIVRDVRRILRFDDDLSQFYKLVKTEKSLGWITKIGAGRLLRSPTVFEDLVKTICTTNCSWAMTEKMVVNLVEKLGASSDGGKRTFPTAEAMAGVSPDFYKNEIRAGYRSGYFVELAEKVAGGKLNPELWLDSKLPTRELKKQMKSVKGVGDYAAENLLKLVGSYEGLALDSWVRAGFYAKHNNQQICDDREIEKFYERFGEWRGLAAWCDMTEKWFD